VVLGLDYLVHHSRHWDLTQAHWLAHLGQGYSVTLQGALGTQQQLLRGTQEAIWIGQTRLEIGWIWVAMLLVDMV
jgi:hypothetical protein